jgi:hypothetical protein
LGASKRDPRDPKRPQEASKRFQEAPKKLQEAPKGCSRELLGPLGTCWPFLGSFFELLGGLEGKPLRQIFNTKGCKTTNKIINEAAQRNGEEQRYEARSTILTLFACFWEASGGGL